MGLDITVVTGFLGAGKTSLLRDLAALWPDAALIASDAAATPFDAGLVDAAAVAGCLCCAGRASLRGQLDRLCGRVVIETSGLSDMAALLVELEGQVGRVIALVDAAGASGPLLASPEARSQLAAADLCLLTHLDALPPEASVERRKEAEALIAPLVACPIRVRGSREDLAAQLAALPVRAGDRALARAGDHSAMRISDAALPAGVALDDAIGFAQALLCGHPRLLRMKLRVVTDQGRGLLLHVVNGRLMPPEFLDPGIGLLHVLDPWVGPDAVLPLARLFLGAAVPACERLCDGM
jgi:hypothetical protein